MMVCVSDDGDDDAFSLSSSSSSLLLPLPSLLPSSSSGIYMTLLTYFAAFLCYPALIVTHRE